MPLYLYGCDHCGHTFEKTLKIAERHQPCEEACPECKEGNINIRPSALNIVSTAKTNLTPPDGFKDVLNRIKSNNRGSTIDV